MVAVLSLLLVVILSILVTKVAAIALVHTGLSAEIARFQARSAFTGVGFTTSEAEGMVRHPVRRRVVMLLMLLGNAGIVSAISSLVLTFVRPAAEAPHWPLRLGAIVGGLGLLWLLASSPALDRGLARLVGWALRRWTRLDVRDYASLLQLSGDYQVQELRVQEGDWLAGKPLEGLALPREGVLVLGIHRPDGR